MPRVICRKSEREREKIEVTREVEEIERRTEMNRSSTKKKAKRMDWIG